MIKYVEWVEPFHYYDGNDTKVPTNKYITRIIRVTTEDAIILQKAKVAFNNKCYGRNFIYESDQKALDDFVIEHWGTIIEEEE